MAIENVELMNECCPKLLWKETDRKKFGKYSDEEGKHKRVNVKSKGQVIVLIYLL